jgi:hypothetical protein
MSADREDRARGEAGARFHCMNDKDERNEEKQTTQAIAQQPQEEFIGQENVPSKTEAEVREESGSGKSEPPRH